VIGPGLVWRDRALGRKRIFAYTRRRPKRRRPAHGRRVRPTCDARDVLFDLGKQELPTATLVHKRETARTLFGAFSGWLLARWYWLTPRVVPVLVATVGMILVLWSADYLAHSHYEPLPSWRP
jgi:hypothetical protein